MLKKRSRKGSPTDKERDREDEVETIRSCQKTQHAADGHWARVLEKVGFKGSRKGGEKAGEGNEEGHAMHVAREKATLAERDTSHGTQRKTLVGPRPVSFGSLNHRRRRTGASLPGLERRRIRIV